MLSLFFEPRNFSLVAICYDYISHTILRSGNTGIKLLLLYFTRFKLYFPRMSTATDKEQRVISIMK